MSGCGSKTYTGITKEAADRMVKDLQSQGIHAALPEGDINSQGVSAHYNWNESKSTLVVEVRSKPWYAPCSTVWSKLDGLIGGYKK